MSEPKHTPEEVARSIEGHGITGDLANWLAQLDARVFEIERVLKLNDAEESEFCLGVPTLETENAALRSQLVKQAEGNQEMLKEVIVGRDVAEAKLDRLREYARHKSDCGKDTAFHVREHNAIYDLGKCDCGLTELLEEE